VSQPRIFHNPRCSKSRQTLALLEERGLTPDVVLYLESPPSVEELDTLLSQLHKQPLELIRTKEATFKELGLSKGDERPRDEWLALMHAHPILIERPIVVVGDKAAVGRPPESVLDIL
jgi:arsenate reductase